MKASIMADKTKKINTTLTVLLLFLVALEFVFGLIFAIKGQKLMLVLTIVVCALSIIVIVAKMILVSVFINKKFDSQDEQKKDKEADKNNKENSASITDEDIEKEFIKVIEENK